MNRSFAWIVWGAVVAGMVLLAAPWAVPLLDPTGAPTRLSPEERQTLQSLEKLSDYPLYSMTFTGDYDGAPIGDARVGEEEPDWACALIAVKGADGPLLGRNFDWPRHPALLLFTDPPNAYATITMVDLSYLVDPADAGCLTELAVDERRALLAAPHWPFDGMNECGLAVGMAAVPSTPMPYREDVRTVSSLQAMREILDHAATVGEALEIVDAMNIDMTGGPTLHYLVADAHGDAALIEFWDGEMIVLRADGALYATNYLLSQTPEPARPGVCWRYDTAAARLSVAEGLLGVSDMMSLLSEVRQESPEFPDFGTQWSIVYELEAARMHLVIERAYGDVRRFDLTTDAGH